MASPRASTPQAKATKQRKIGSRSCDGCKIRKVKCTEQPPCERCRAVGIECTFNKTPAVRGPRSLRAKTLEQIRKAQQDGLLPASSSPADKQPPAQPASAPSNHNRPQPEISVESLVLRLCIYRVRLFPVWPIVAVEEVIAALHRDAHHVETFALAVAVGAATMAQLKLERFQDGGVDDAVTAQLLESECQRIRRAHGLDSGAATLNKLRTSFFLHIYHENQEPGGTQSLLYMREAITLAQIMGLHRVASYLGLDAAEDRLRRRIIWLLFVTERGVSMLHGLPLVLTSTDRLPPLAVSSSDDEAHVLPAFKKLVNLFWIFDQSRAFEILQDTADQASNGTASLFNQELLNTLFRRLQDAPLEMENGSSDVQKADICVTRQWMQVLIWRATLGSSRHGDSSQASAAATAPIHIAQEFLDFISQLPSAALEAHGPAIEFKVYEIASAVADAVAGPLCGHAQTAALGLVNGRTASILVKLQRILATTRGGNSSLLNQLAARIAHLKAPAFPAPEFVSAPQHDIDEQWQIPYPGPSDQTTSGQTPGRSPYSMSSPSAWLSLVAAAELEQQTISDGHGPPHAASNTVGTTQKDAASQLELQAPVSLGGRQGHAHADESGDSMMRGPTMNWYTTCSTQPLGLLGQHGVYNLPADNMNGNVMRHGQHGGQGQPSGETAAPSPGDIAIADLLNGQNWLLGTGSPRIP